MQEAHQAVIKDITATEREDLRLVWDTYKWPVRMCAHPCAPVCVCVSVGCTRPRPPISPVSYPHVFPSLSVCSSLA